MAFSAAVLGRGRYLRPVSVQARPYAGQNFGIEIIGLRDLLRLPEELQIAYEQMLFRLQAALEVMAKSVVPGGPEGKLGRQVHARRLSGGGNVSNRIVLGTVGSEFARALDRGFSSKAKNGKALRFTDEGQTFYRKGPVRVAGRHFFAKWIEGAPPIVDAVYVASFRNVKRG